MIISSLKPPPPIIKIDGKTKCDFSLAGKDFILKKKTKAK